MKERRVQVPMDYDNYIFDLYGTLVDIHTEEDNCILWEKLAYFYGFYGATYQPDDLHESYLKLVSGVTQKDTHEAFPELEITSVFQKLFKKKGVDASVDLAVHTGQFFRILSMDYVRLYQGSIELLQQLRDNHKRIFLLSNAQRIFTQYEMRYLGLIDYFDDIFISSDFGVKKPDPTFFAQLQDRYRLDPKATLFVGNDGTTDIKGAKAMEYATFYVQSNISPKEPIPEANYVIKEFQGWSLD